MRPNGHYVTVPWVIHFILLDDLDLTFCLSPSTFLRPYSPSPSHLAFPRHDKTPYIVWTDSAQSRTDDGRFAICPRASICSEGALQVALISVARLTGIGSYVVQGMTFLSKMHSTIHFLSSTYIATIIPFESFHHVHAFIGSTYCGMITLHTIVHLARWALRREMAMCWTTTGASGIVGMTAMAGVVFVMSPWGKKVSMCGRKLGFEDRFTGHWFFFCLLSAAICFHHPRTRRLTLSYFLLWAIDYLYGIIFRTHRLDVVEFTTLPGNAGTQMLWRNPEGFKSRSGEYVQIKVPWLPKSGRQKEWHPFSIYLNEATKEGMDEVMRATPGSSSSEEDEDELDDNDSWNGGSDHDPELDRNLEDFVKHVLSQPYSEGVDAATAARQGLNTHETTQVFMYPSGGWTREVATAVSGQKQLRACWVRGPYTSPYHVTKDFSHILLAATGIGITPALGVMGQYPGASRTKLLVWSVREPNMLKFFAPLLGDAHAVAVFYTGPPLGAEELASIRSHGNIFVRQGRPDSLVEAIAGLIVLFERVFSHERGLSKGSSSSSGRRRSGEGTIRVMSDIPLLERKNWVLLYCGGSIRIRDELGAFARSARLGWQAELFDW